MKIAKPQEAYILDCSRDAFNVDIWHARYLAWTLIMSDNNLDGKNLLHRILLNSPDLLSLYLIMSYNEDRIKRFTTEPIASFLLWFALYGRWKHKEIANFDEGYLDFLNLRLPNGTRFIEDALTNQDILRRGAGDSTITNAFNLLKTKSFIRSADIVIPDNRPSFENGVSIVGFHRNTLGIGEDARTLFHILKAIGIPVSLVNIGNARLEVISELDEYIQYESEFPIFSIVIICAPLFETARVMTEWGRGFIINRHVIGYWPWELTGIPPYWRHMFDAVDEIWASTTFLEGVYNKITSTPVIKVPLYVSVSEPDFTVMIRHGINRKKFMFVSFMDFNSTMRRKNAIAAVIAFKNAFADRSADVGLVIKTTHLEERSVAFRELMLVIDNDVRIQIIDGPLSRREICGIIASCDAFVSLHRAEGFGRVIAESMLLKVPVIATDWSGSRDLLSAKTGFPVKYALVDVPYVDYIEAAGQWAEPDLNHAEIIFKLVHDNKREVDAATKAAFQHVSSSFSLNTVSMIVKKRLLEIDKAIRINRMSFK